MQEVTIYSTPTCPYCQMAKKFFKEKGVEYNEIDVADDEKKAHEMIEKSGQMGVPVIVVKMDGKEEVMVGFDQPKLMELLGLS